MIVPTAVSSKPRNSCTPLMQFILAPASNHPCPSATPNNLPDLLQEIEQSVWFLEVLASSTKYNHHSSFTLVSSTFSELKIQMVGRLTRPGPNSIQQCKPRPKYGEQQATAAVKVVKVSKLWSDIASVPFISLLCHSIHHLYFLVWQKVSQLLRNSHQSLHPKLHTYPG